MKSKSDILIAGSGIVGLSLALELHASGATVGLLEAARDGERAVGQASWAAAGMLAVEDPHNPPDLREIARWSGSLYDAFLARIADLSGEQVPYQTQRTLQFVQGGAQALDERSVDPRELMLALERAVAAAGIPVRRGFRVERMEEGVRDVTITSADGKVASAGQLVFANGAWCRAVAGVAPRKGQMLRVAVPPQEAERGTVYRAEEIYVVPRTAGPGAGTALVGATVEDVGFDTAVDAGALESLRERAARLSPDLAWVREAPVLEAWCGFRPGSPTELPLIGRLPERQRTFVATGHFRNGILLAPATAVLLADILEGRRTAISAEPFAPSPATGSETNRAG